MTDRYILCRPRGGLNDTLCRIAKCWDYAEQFNRHLVIDCQQSCLFGNFSDFFQIADTSQGVSAALDEKLLDHLNSLPCRPVGLTGRLDQYTTRYDLTRGYVDVVTDQPTRFTNTYPAQFVDDFPEPLLVYDDSGGGTESHSLFTKVTFAKNVQSQLLDSLADLATPYLAVHVRNTDYQTDYRTLFARIRRRVGRNRLLVCSDDRGVIDYAQRYFEGPVLTIGERVPSVDPTGALHRQTSHATPEKRRQAVLESLVDLVCLGNAQTLFYAPAHSVLDSEMLRDTGRLTFRSLGYGLVSGFSTLAQHLCQHKNVLDELLAVPESSRRAPDPLAAVQVDLRSPTRQALSRCRNVVSRISGRLGGLD